MLMDDLLHFLKIFTLINMLHNTKIILGHLSKVVSYVSKLNDLITFHVF